MTAALSRGAAPRPSRAAVSVPTDGAGEPLGRFRRATRRLPVDRTPVWFMRQAGRTLPEYRKLRERWTLLQMCADAELCAEVTLQPMRRMPLDAAVMFGDIMIPLIGVGVELDIVEKVGPVIAHPIRDMAGVEALRTLEPERDLPAIMEAVRLVRRELAPERAVLGFAGAPFTLAAYLVEGRGTRDFVKTKALMHGAPDVWHALMTRLSDVVVAFLRGNAMAGADALQLFDSWVGALSATDYATHVRPHVQRIFAELQDLGLPLVHFGTNTAHLLDLVKDEGGTIIGLDWRVPIDVAWARVGHHLGVQGNLDPATLFAPLDVVEAATRDVLDRAGGRPGHVFNLGHGLHPETPLAAIERVVETVQGYRLASPGAPAV
ncbi:MAG TPA: uroporphyrinogen decarboxylase [Gemmatirosa sp.]|nr:uroporphyrinogen decarboxylase [Gemmatirosa sp.]